MRENFNQKYYTFLLLLIAVFFGNACKGKFNQKNKQIVSTQKMESILVDIFLTDALIQQNANYNAQAIKNYKTSLYPKILKHHKIDSTSFYTTYNYFLNNPEKNKILLDSVKSKLGKILEKTPITIKTENKTNKQPINKVPPSSIDLRDSMQKMLLQQQEEMTNNQTLRERRKNKK